MRYTIYWLGSCAIVLASGYALFSRPETKLKPVFGISACEITDKDQHTIIQVHDHMTGRYYFVSRVGTELVIQEVPAP